MKVLVVGGTGTVGAAVVQQLLARKADLRLFVRDAKTNDALEWLTLAKFYKHLGIYAFRCEFLLNFVQLPQSDLEKTEKLEQLRALENGFSIKVWITPHDSIGVDRPEDVELVEEILKSQA